MNILKPNRGGLAAIAILLVTGFAPAQHIARVQNGSLPEVKQTVDLDRLAVGLNDPTLKRLQGSTSLLRIPFDSTTDGTGGMLMRLQSKGAVVAAKGANQQITRMLYGFEPISADLIGKGHTAERVIAPGAMNRLLDSYGKLVSGDVQAPVATVLGPQQLRSIALPNGWEFRFLGSNTYSISDRQTGHGFRVWGDPHFDKIAADGQPNVHVGDFTSDCVCELLPGREVQFPMVVLARSTGGDDKNAFGMPTTLLAMDNQRFVYIEGLNTDNPTGVSGEGALFAYQAFASDFARAHALYWVESVGELRTADGSRPAPPASARQYNRATPSARVEPAELYGEHFRLVRDTSQGELPAMDRELMERFKQAKSASTASQGAIRAKADDFISKARAYGQSMVTYVTERQKLMDELRALNDRLEDIYRQLGEPNVKPKRAEELNREAQEISNKMDALFDRVKTVDGRKPEPTK